MSTTIDNEVVRMEFENSNFEANVSTSLSTLDKLKHALNFDQMGKSLKSISDQTGKLDMDNLNASAATVQSRFSVLGTIATGALMSIGSAAVSAGARMLKALSVQPIIDGFHEYEQTMNSTKTIMANLPNETIPHINATLAQLNKYADDTIYNFSDMTSAIGQFTAAGVDLDTATTAIKGMANVAAGAGASNTTLARAEYQVSQALQSGTIRLMDWNSLVQAGMANPELQEQIKQTAREQGVAVDSIVSKYGSFRDSLQSGWLTADIFTKTMAKAADTSNSWGARLTEAATQVNTFTQLVSVLNESIGSSWTNTWQLILGDYQESKAFFTDLYNMLNPLIDGMGNFRNGILQTWAALGGRTAMVNGIKDGIQGIINLFGPFTRGFSKLLGGSGNALADISKAFAKGMAAFKNWTAGINSAAAPIKKVLEPVATTAKTANDAVNQVSNSVKDLGAVARQVINGDFGSGEARVKALREAGYSFEEVQNKVNELLGCDKRYAVQANETNKTITNQAKVVKQAAQSVKTQTQAMTTAQRSAKNFGDTIGGVFSVIDIFKNGLDVINTGLTRTIGVIGRLAGSGLKVILAITGGLGRVLTAIDNLMNSVGVFKTLKGAVNGFFDSLNGPLDLIDSFADVAAEGIGKFFDMFVGFIKSAQPNIAAFTKAMAPAVNVVRSWLNMLKDAGGKIFGKIPSVLNKAAGAVKSFISGLNFGSSGDIFGGLNSGLATFGGAVSSIAGGAFKKLKTFASDALTILKNFGGFVKSNLPNALNTVHDVFLTALDGIKKFASFVGGNLSTTVEKAGGFISSFASGVGDAFSSVFGPTKAYAKSMDTSASATSKAHSSMSKSAPGITSALDKIRDAFANAGKKIDISGFTKGIANAIRGHSIADVGIAIGAFAIRIKNAIVEKFSHIDIANAIKNAFSTYIIPAFGKIGKWLSNGVKAVADNLPGALDILKSALEAFGGGIVGAFENLVSNIDPSIKDAIKAIEDRFKGFIQAIKDIFKKVADTISGVQKTVDGGIGNISNKSAGDSLVSQIEKALGIGAAFNLSRSLANTSKVWSNLTGSVKSIAKSVKIFAKGINNFAKAAKWGAIALVIIAFANSISKIANAISTLGNMDTGKLWQGAIAVGAIAAVMGGILAGIELYKQHCAKINATVKEVTGKDNPMETLNSFIGSIKSSLSTMSTGLKIASLAAAIAAIGIVVTLLSKAVATLGSLQPDQLAQGLLALTTILVGVSGFMLSAAKLAEHMGNGSNAVLKMAASIALVAASFVAVSRQLQSNDLQTTATALGILGGLLLALAGVDLILSHFAGASSGKDAATAVLMLSAALILVAKAFSDISNAVKSAGGETAKTSLIILTVLLAELTAVDIALSAFADNGASLKSAAAVVLLAYALNLMCQGIASIPDPSGSIPIVIGLGVLLAEVGVVIGILAYIDPGGALAAAGGIALAFAGMAALVLSISQIKNVDGATAILDKMGQMAIVIGIILGALAGVGPEAMMAGAAMALVGFAFLELGVAMRIGAGALKTTVSALNKLTQVIDKMGDLDAGSVNNFKDILKSLSVLNLTSALAGITGGGDAVAKTINALAKLSKSMDIWNAADYSQAADNINEVCTAVGKSFGNLGSILGGLTGGGENIAKVLTALSKLSGGLKKWQSDSTDFDAVGDNMKSICQKIAGAFKNIKVDDESVTSISKAMGTLPSMAKHIQSWANVTTNPETIRTALKAVAKGVEGFVGTTDGANAMKSAAPSIKTIAKAIASWSGVTVDPGYIKRTMSAVATGTSQFIGKDSGAATMSIAAKPVKTIASALQAWGAVTVSSGTISGLLSAVATGTSKFASASDGAAVMKTVSSGLGKLATDISKFVGIDPGVGTTIGTILGGISSHIGPFAGLGGSAATLALIAGPLGSLASTCGLFAGIDPGVGSKINGILSGLSTGLMSLSTGIVGIFALAMVSGPLQALASACSAYAAVDGAGIGASLSALSTGIATFNGAAGASLIISAVGLQTLGVSAMIAGAGTQVASVGISAAAGALSRLSGSFGSIPAQFSTLGAAAQSSATAIVSGLQPLPSRVSSIFSSMRSTINSASSSMASSAKSHGSKIGSNFASGISSKASNAGSAAKKCVQAAKSAFNNSGSARQAGAYFAQGYAAGISSGAGAVGRAARALAQRAMAEVNKAQATGSPAKKLIIAGKWFSAGYTVGIKKHTDDAVKAAANMAQMSVNAVADTTRNGSALSPTIRPILDSKSIQNGSAQFSDALNAQVRTANQITMDHDYSEITSRLDDILALLPNSKQPLVGTINATTSGHTDADIVRMIAEVVADAIDDGRRKADMNVG